jgi:hypothetical protein
MSSLTLKTYGHFTTVTSLVLLHSHHPWYDHYANCPQAGGCSAEDTAKLEIPFTVRALPAQHLWMNNYP